MTERSPERMAAFEFARRLADPQFRNTLKAMGCAGEQDVVVTLDQTLVVEVFDRVFTRTKPPALVAIRRPSESAGFVFMQVSPAVHPAGAPKDLDVSDGDKVNDRTSIGMLFDTATAGHHATYDVGARWGYNLQPAKPDLALA